MTKELYKVTYRPIGKGTKQAIIHAASESEATKHFNDPEDFTLNHEIRNVTKSEIIPAGWVVTSNDHPFEKFKTRERINPKKVSSFTAYAMSDGVKATLEVSEILSVVPPSKDKGAMKAIW